MAATGAYVSSTMVAATSGAATAVAVPAGVADGDLLLWWITILSNNATAATFPFPAGWAKLSYQNYNNSVAANNAQGILLMRKASSEPASYTVTVTSPAAVSIIHHVVVAYRGVSAPFGTWPGSGWDASATSPVGLPFQSLIGFTSEIANSAANPIKVPRFSTSCNWGAIKTGRFATIPICHSSRDATLTIGTLHDCTQRAIAQDAAYGTMWLADCVWDHEEFPLFCSNLPGANRFDISRTPTTDAWNMTRSVMINDDDDFTSQFIPSKNAWPVGNTIVIARPDFI